VLFRRFLDRILPDAEVQDWLQRWFGYCLTADYSENKLACLWGEGRNGKGVLTHLLQWLYGDYAAVLQFASLLADERRRGSEASPDLAQLPGMRAVFGSEPKKGAKLDDGMVKQITGGDDLKVRHLNRDFFDLHPTFKLTLSFNNKPQIRDDSHGMWSRVMLVPFTVIIPEAEIDRALLAKLQREGPGILNWCLDGFRRWRDIGLTAPQAILAATAEYRSESDRIGQFLDAATVPHENGEIPATHLYACYEGWCKAMEHRPVSQTLFGRELSRRTIKPEKRGVMLRLGLKWKPDDIDWDWQVPYG
jgi:putative DNA primase/helicase